MGDVVVDFFRVDVTGILKHYVDLLIEMLTQVALQGRQRLGPQAGRNSISVAGLDVLIEDFFGVHQDQRPGGA